MTRIKLPVAVAAVMLAATAAAAAEWQQEPNSYRDIPFGATVAEVTKVVTPFIWPCASAPKGSCLLSTRIIGKSEKKHSCHPGPDCAPLTEIFTFDDGKFVEVSLSFPVESYDFVKAVFIEKYGLPANVKAPTVETRAGAEFQSEQLNWSGEHIRISLDKFGSSLNTSTAILLNREWAEKSAREREDAAKKTAKSFK